MEKQLLLFPNRENDEATRKYTSKVESPVYEPRGVKPHVTSLCDLSTVARLCRSIEASDVPEEEKAFLRLAAYRHAVFHYERIADYYAQASPGMQRRMEESALIIIDFDKAIERGFVQLSSEIARQFMEEYETDDPLAE